MMINKAGNTPSVSRGPGSITISSMLAALVSIYSPVPLAESTGIQSWYLGAGLGITELDPAVGGTGYEITDERDTGFKLFAGADFNDRLSVEAFYADLGAAQIGNHVIKPDGAIDYSTMGVSALWYAWRSGESVAENTRKGLQLFLHGGLSFLDNSASVDYDQDNSVQVQYGAGIEYGLNDGYAVRAAFDLYDVDAGMVYVGILKRFGVKQSNPLVQKTSGEPPVVEPADQGVEAMIPEVMISYDIDSDQDGVFDRHDQCADSPINIEVDETGCSILSVELEGVNFERNAYTLTEDSKGILDKAVTLILDNPALKKIEVQAHTDDRGSEKYNLRLSEQRAAAVMEYLLSRGIASERLSSKGYGESRPVADNDTEEGRAKNRRVELKVLTDTPE